MLTKYANFTNPTKFRFIVASPVSSLKPLLKAIASELKLMFNHWKL